MTIYKYTIPYYAVPNDWINSNGDLIDHSIREVEDNCLFLKDEVLATSNSNPNEFVKKHLKSVPLLKGKTYMLASGTRTELLDSFKKNIEFCRRAELESPHINNQLDKWIYLDWCASDALLGEEVKELRQAIKGHDEVETLDGAYDVAIIALNIAYKLLRKKGIEHNEAVKRTEIGFDRTVDSNLTKLKNDGIYKPLFRKDGKVLKGENFIPPTYDDLLKV
jgi:hypothetical protein